MPARLKARGRPLPPSELCPVPAAFGGVHERTFVAIKPDGVQRRLVGEIIRRFERKGLQLVGMKLLQVSGWAHPGWGALQSGSPCSPPSLGCAGNCWGFCLSSGPYNLLLSFQQQIPAAQRRVGTGRGDSSCGEHVCPCCAVLQGCHCKLAAGNSSLCQAPAVSLLELSICARA